MKRFASLVFVVAGIALAQNATVQINEVDVLLGVEHIRFVNGPGTDGGCFMVAYGAVQSPSVAPQWAVSEYQLSGASCRNMRADGLLAIKRDMRRANVAIGDGGVP